MKEFVFKNVAALFVIFIFSVSCVYGNVITAPIDGRPVSMEYLKNLAAINGEEFFAPQKDNLDMFPINTNYSRFADSESVRKEIKKFVSESNTSDTAVIINTSSYMTAGLVGSRCGDNYKDYEQALEELDSLVTAYSEPKYYVNVSMPRTLPETRMNSIWRDNKNCRGMGYYYVKYNPDCEDKKFIGSKFFQVSPSQIIMEWSYINNKRYELGEDSLMPWEKDFIWHFENVYKSMEPYKTYLSKYILPFSAVSEIFSRLMKMQKDGKIDEIVISNDDFQIPDFITYFNGKGAEWIPRENGNPIKFSFARSYITNGPRSIYKLLKDSRGIYEANRAINGQGENINFIFGTDEIPQLIYARHLSKTKNISSDINIITTSSKDEVRQFDVLSANSLIKNDLSFVSAGKNKTGTKIDLYLFDYAQKDISAADVLRKMEESRKNGRDVGLIELYSGEVSASGENILFKKLLNNSKEKNGNIGISNLSCYSAWNTNANAIGLGMAHAQVFGIMKKYCTDEKAFISAHLKVLSAHCAEDGFYTVSGKRILTNEKFIPVYEDTIKSEKLLPVIGAEEVISAFKDSVHIINGKKYSTKKFDISNYNFPWGRLFECYVDFDSLVEL